MVRFVDDECCGFIDKFLKSKPAWKIFAFFGFLEFFLELSNISEVFHELLILWASFGWKDYKSCSVCRGLKHHKNFAQSYAFASFNNWCNFFVLKFCSSAVSLCFHKRVILLFPQIPRIFSQNPLKNLILLGKCLQLANRKPSPNFTMSPFYIEFYESSFPLMR